MKLDELKIKAFDLRKEADLYEFKRNKAIEEYNKLFNEILKLEANHADEIQSPESVSMSEQTKNS